MERFIPAPPAAVTRVLMNWDRKTLAAFIAVAIDLMDVADGDPDEESDPFNEGEPAFDHQSRAMVNVHPDSCPNGDAEEDDHSGGNVEDEGEPEEPEADGAYGMDQRDVGHVGGAWRV